LAGRAVRPIGYNGNVNTAQQHLWSDAVFIRDLMRLGELSEEALFKLALLMECYGSVNVSHFVLTEIDKRQKSDFAITFLQRLLSASG